MLMKVIKDDINRQKDIPYSWCQNDYTTQGNLQSLFTNQLISKLSEEVEYQKEKEQ